MAKFYVQCGSDQLLTSADCPRGAAIWAVHRSISQRVDTSSIDWLDPATIDRVDVLQAMLDLDDWIAVSEIGFGRQDAGLFESALVLSEWNQLVVAATRLAKEYSL